MFPINRFASLTSNQRELVSNSNMDKEKLFLVFAGISTASLVAIALNSSHERNMFKQCIETSLKYAPSLPARRNASLAYSHCMGGPRLY